MNEQLIKLAAKITWAIVGDTLFLFSKDNAKERDAVIRHAQRKGELVRWHDHSKTWFEDFLIADLSKEAAEQYTWDKSGNRVLHKRYRLDQDRDGRTTRTFIRNLYKGIDS